MPALSFKKEFVPQLESGEKRQTIRACRKDNRDPKQGENLYIYTGMRTKACKKLFEVECKTVQDIEISDTGRSVVVDGEFIDKDRFNKLAVDDGFSCTEEFVAFFEKSHGLPFVGKLIKW